MKQRLSFKNYSITDCNVHHRSSFPFEISLCTDAATLFDMDGINVRFMNGDVAGNNIKNAQDVIDFVGRVNTCHFQLISELPEILSNTFACF